MSADADQSGRVDGMKRRTVAWAASSPSASVTLAALRRARVAGLAKYVVIVAALSLIGLVVGWPDLIGRDDGLTFKRIEIDGETSDLRMVNARYVGTDSSNRPFVITADSATHHATDKLQITLDRLEAEITVDRGEQVSIRAATGVYHQQRQTLFLSGGVSLFSDRGYTVHAEDADVDLEEGLASSKRPVRGYGPLGRLRAQTFAIRDHGKILRFEGNVKMVAYPQAKG